MAKAKKQKKQKSNAVVCVPANNCHLRQQLVSPPTTISLVVSDHWQSYSRGKRLVDFSVGISVIPVLKIK